MGCSDPVVNKISSDNLIHWYDASDLSTVFEDAACTTAAEDGDGVGCLKDKAGSDHLIQATPGSKPVIVYDGHKGKPVLKFSGNQLLRDAADSTPGFSGNQPYNIFMVVNVSYHNSKQALIHYGDSTAMAISDSTGIIPMIASHIPTIAGRIYYAGLDKFTGQMTTLRLNHEVAPIIQATNV